MDVSIPRRSQRDHSVACSSTVLVEIGIGNARQTQPLLSRSFLHPRERSRKAVRFLRGALFFAGHICTQGPPLQDPERNPVPARRRKGTSRGRSRTAARHQGAPGRVRDQRPERGLVSSGGLSRVGGLSPRIAKTTSDQPQACRSSLPRSASQGLSPPELTQSDRDLTVRLAQLRKKSLSFSPGVGFPEET